MKPAPSRGYEYYKAALQGWRLPAAFIDLDALDANLADLSRRADHLPIRLVTKSVRSVDILRRLLAATPKLQGLLCFAAAEAAWLAELGFDDLVVAYPTTEDSEISEVAEWIRAGKSITLMVDNVSQLDQIEDHGRAHGVTMSVAIDLDMSTRFPGLRFGVYRSPIDGPEKAVALAREIGWRDHLRLDGLMGYEGQIAGLMDQAPGEAARNLVIQELKRRSIPVVRARRTATVAALENAGYRLRFVNGGGSGSLESTGADPSVTELAAGSGLYCPTLFDHYRTFQARPAAGFALPICRSPGRGVVTCTGGGYSASGPFGANRLPQPWLPEGGQLITNEGAGEVQTPVRFRDDSRLAIRDPILFRHAKAGELCERFNELLLIQDGKVVDAALTYRGAGRCFS